MIEKEEDTFRLVQVSVDSEGQICATYQSASLATRQLHPKKKG